MLHYAVALAAAIRVPHTITPGCAVHSFNALPLTRTRPCTMGIGSFGLGMSSQQPGQHSDHDEDSSGLVVSMSSAGRGSDEIRRRQQAEANVATERRLRREAERVAAEEKALREQAEAGLATAKSNTVLQMVLREAAETANGDGTATGELREQLARERTEARAQIELANAKAAAAAECGAEIVSQVEASMRAELQSNAAGVAAAEARAATAEARAEAAEARAEAAEARAEAMEATGAAAIPAVPRPVTAESTAGDDSGVVAVPLKQSHVSLYALPGLGRKTANTLRRHGIRNVEDLRVRLDDEAAAGREPRLEYLHELCPQPHGNLHRILDSLDALGASSFVVS